MADDEKKKASKDEEHHHDHGHGDATEVKEILDVVSEKIPALLNSLTDVLYGKEQAVKYGQAVAGFYKALKDSGMNDAQAYELTKQYTSSLNIGGFIGDAIKSGKGDDDDDDDIGKSINIRIKKKLKEKGLSDDECCDDEKEEKKE